MGITSLQVCMDSSDWLHQGTISEENTGMESSPITPSSDQEDILTCSRSPLIERRIRPQNEQALKCPRCESTHTKFCYYNNYSLSQPRYFCKTCRRYWTKGGTLRNIPVGGGCRKNKKVSSNSKKSSSNDLNPSPSILNQQNYSTTTGLSPSPLISHQNYNHFNNNNNNNSTELQLAFPDQIHFSSLHSSGLFNTNNIPNHSFLFENPTPIDFMENKYETLVAGSHGFMGNGENFGGINGGLLHNNFHGICSSFEPDHHQHGINSSTPGTILESCQRLMLPYENHHEVDVKPNPSKILPLEWHDHQQQACNSDSGISYLGGIGTWTGLMNAYGSSNPLV